MRAPRRERVVLLVVGVAIGAKLPAGQIDSQLAAVVFLVLVIAVVFLLLLPTRRLPWTAAELQQAVEDYTARKRKARDG